MVRILNGSLFDGCTGRKVSSYDVLYIEDDFVMQSRRGPNQKIGINREHDKTGKQIYDWYPIFKVDGNYLNDGREYLRAGTFLIDGVLSKHLESGQRKRLASETRERAKSNVKTYQKVLKAVKDSWSRNPKDVLDRIFYSKTTAWELGDDMRIYASKLVNQVLAEEETYTKEVLQGLVAQDEAFYAPQLMNEEKWGEAVKKFDIDWGKAKGNQQSILKQEAKQLYGSAIRARLMQENFVVSPSGLPVGAIFPKKDWVIRSVPIMNYAKLKDTSDDLMRKYNIIGDDVAALTRMLKLNTVQLKEDHPLVRSVGCVCISWTYHRDANKGEYVYIPILGVSSAVDCEVDAVYFEKYLRHLALPKSTEHETFIPVKANTTGIDGETLNARRDRTIIARRTDNQSPWAKEAAKKITRLENTKKQITTDHNEEQKGCELKHVLRTNYETMIQRTNDASIEMRIRTALGLRTPARQALMSYVSFRENKGSDKLLLTKLETVSTGADLWICGWHSLNCAEPAALVCASSVFGKGCDVVICFPYEGIGKVGNGLNRPKETCPWCAAVELSFRSIYRSTKTVEECLDDGGWLAVVTDNLTEEPMELPTGNEFNAYDEENEIMTQTKATLGEGDGSSMLVKNTDLKQNAYDTITVTKIGRVRSLYYMLGLIDKTLVATSSSLFSFKR